MKYYSLNNPTQTVDFSTATVQGQAPDKGLYFPEKIPVLPKGFVEKLPSLSKEEIGVTVMQPFVDDSLPKAQLESIVAETINFPFPLKPINKYIASLELYHGPTLAFKDVGARFMSRCLGYFNRNNTAKVTVLVATSGDTGGAVANGFLGVEGVEVIILYPSKKVSAIQELQLTTLGQNITALEIEGTFDDCQAIVKNAFIDADFNTNYTLTSANSINVARWLPQQLYYFFAAQQWQEAEPPVICVPSGNFGNICAAILAFIQGLPVKHFIAACNANDVVPNYMQLQQYHAKPAVATISNAMDVGNPSNFVRILQLFNNQFQELQHKFSSVSISDQQTKQTIQKVHQQYQYILDPHGAVAYYALEQMGEKGYITETAHPIKFPDVVEEMISETLPIPVSVQHLLHAQKQAILLPNTYIAFKEWMMNR